MIQVADGARLTAKGQPAKGNGWGGARPGAGRKPKPATEPQADAWTESIYADRETWEYLNTFLSTGNPSEQLREAVHYLRKFMPGGAGTTAAMKPATIERIRKQTLDRDAVEARRIRSRGARASR